MDKRFEKILKTSKAERLLLLLMAIAFIFILVVGIAEKTEASTSQENDTSILNNQFPGILRFHVIANSDSKEDQDLKLRVRDYVLERLQTEIKSEIEVKGYRADEYDVRQYIGSNLSRIEGWAEECLDLNDSSYGCKASVEVRHIPAKYYDDILFPEGNYEALTITIGEGKGQNWWCVVFPPLCLVDADEDESPYTDKLDMPESDKLELKFKLLELLEKYMTHQLERDGGLLFC